MASNGRRNCTVFILVMFAQSVIIEIWGILKLEAQALWAPSMVREVVIKVITFFHIPVIYFSKAFFLLDGAPFLIFWVILVVIILIVLRNLLLVLMLMLVIINSHWSTALRISDIRSRELMAIIWVNHVTNRAGYQWLTRELFSLPVVLIQLGALLGLWASFMVQLLKLAYLDLAVVERKRHMVEFLLGVFLEDHTHSPLVVSISMTVVQTFVSATARDSVYVLAVPV